MPQMSPLWWLIFPVVMVMVVIVLVANLFEMLIDKGEMKSLSGSDESSMWW